MKSSRKGGKAQSGKGEQCFPFMRLAGLPSRFVDSAGPVMDRPKNKFPISPVIPTGTGPVEKCGSYSSADPMRNSVAS